MVSRKKNISPHLEITILIAFFFADAIASSDNVRIASSLKSQKGAIWTKSKTNFKWWEVEIVFRITGRGRLGADGLVSIFYLIFSD